MPDRFGQFARLAMTFLVLTAWPGPSGAADSAVSPRTLVMGTGGVTGFYFPVGGAVCRVVNALRSRAGLRCLIESTTGSLQNLNGLKTGDFDLAVVQSGWAYQAVRGIGAFAVEGKGSDLRALMALHGEPLTLVVRKDSGIVSAADLKRHKVSLGRKGTAQRQLMEALLEAQGFTMADFPQAVEMEADEQVDALCSGKIEAAAYVIAHPISVIEEALSRCNARLINVDGRTVQKLGAANPFLVPVTIPENIYAGQDKPVQTFGMQALLAATARLSNGDAEMIVSGILDNFERFQRLHPSLELLHLDKLSATEPVMPLHDGARRAFRERKLLPK